MLHITMRIFILAGMMSLIAATCNDTDTLDHASCSDGYPCTVDQCEPEDETADVFGCTHVKNDLYCDDDVDCTTNTCSPNSAGASVSGCILAYDNDRCDDEILCSNNRCTLTGCVTELNHSVCNNDNICTTDTCDPVNSTVADGCIHIDGCTETEDCIIELEQGPDGWIKPYNACIYGRTFSTCLRVQLFLKTHVDELTLNEARPTVNETNKTACNPSPCFGASTCEIIKVTHFKCHCVSGQRGTRCEQVNVGIDEDTPMRLTLIILIAVGVTVGVAMALCCCCYFFCPKEGAINETNNGAEDGDVAVGYINNPKNKPLVF